MPYQGEKYEDVERVSCREGQYAEQICDIHTFDQWGAPVNEKIRVAGVSGNWSDSQIMNESLVNNDPGSCTIYKSERGDGPNNVKILQC